MYNSINSTNVVSDDLFNNNDVLNYLKNFIDINKMLKPIICYGRLDFDTVGKNAEYTRVNFLDKRTNLPNNAFYIKDNILNIPEPELFDGFLFISSYSLINHKDEITPDENYDTTFYQRFSYFENNDFSSAIPYSNSIKSQSFNLKGFCNFNINFLNFFTPNHGICGYYPEITISNDKPLYKHRFCDFIAIAFPKSD
ncbi:MAG: hypothetical protein ACI4XM_03030, partial [Candidatus Coprovivens sp.]